MERSSSSDGLEELLAQRAWVRRVARALVLDDSRADDLEQEAWVGALRGVKPGSPRAWLGTVLRRAASNMRRAEGRRTAHEAAAEPPAPLPSPEEMVERAEVVERVWRAVRGLEEPYRTAVLLRYFEDIPPAVIGERLGVPVETVRTRLRRALALLRERLDVEEGGDRRRWAVLLLPFARPSVPWAPQAAAGGSALAVAVEVLFMALKTKAAVAAGLLLAAGIAVWFMAGGTPSAPGTGGAGGVQPPTEVAVVRDPAAGPAASAAPVVGDAVDPALGGKSRVEVQVQDTGARPVAGATVSLHPAPTVPKEGAVDRLHPPGLAAVLARAATDGSGTCALGGVPAGEWVLVVEADGFARRFEDLRFAEGQALAPVRVVLLRGCSLAGTVFTVDGKPLPNVGVEAVRPWPGGDRGFDRVACRSDASGRFHLEGLAPGTQGLLVTLPGGAVRGGGSVRVPDLQTWDIHLGGGAHFRGRVVNDATGKPVAGAAVTIATKGPQPSGSWNGFRDACAEVRTGADGSFSFPDLPPGTLDRLQVQADGYLDHPDPWFDATIVDTTLSTGGVLEREVRLRRGVEIRGVVTGTEGRPVPGASVIFHGFIPEHGNWGPIQVHSTPPVTTGPDGSFRIPAARPGMGLLEARAPGLVAPGFTPDAWSRMASGLQPGNDSVVEVPLAGELVRNLQLVPSAAVAGIVVDAGGGPLPGYVVTVEPSDRSPHKDVVKLFGEGPRGVSDASGKFLLKEVPPGRKVEVKATGPGGRTGFSSPAETSPGATVEGLKITVAGGASLEGRVGRIDGKPLEDPELRLVEGMRPRTPWWGDQNKVNRQWGRLVPVGPDGRFRVEGLEPGRYQLEARARGCETILGPDLDVKSDDKKEGIEILLEPGLSLSGVVSDETGRPVPGAEVMVVAADYPPYLFSLGVAPAATAVTETQGRFRQDGLSVGKVLVTVRAPRYAVAKATAEADASDLRFVLQPALSIAGTVVEKDSGRPVAGLEVGADPDPRPLEGSWYRGRATTGPDGSFVIENLAPGKYLLAMGRTGSDIDANCLNKEVAGVEAGTHDLQVEVDRGLPLEGRIEDEEGNPVTWGVKVSAWTVADEDAPGPLYAYDAVIGPGGTFRANTRPGTFALHVDPQQSRTGAAPFVPMVVPGIAGGSRDVVVRLHRGAAISGKVVYPIDPSIQQWTQGEIVVRLEGSKDPVPGAGAGKMDFEHGADGTVALRFSTRMLEPGKAYDLEARGFGPTMSARVRGVVAGTSGVVIQLSMGESIAGSVVDEAGSPVANVPVSARAVGGADSGGSSSSTRTGADGAFTLRRLSPGKFRLFAGGPDSDFARTEHPDDVATGATGIKLTAKRGVEVSGRLLAADGKAALGAWIAAEVDGKAFAGAQASKEDGTFRIRGLAPGPVVLISMGAKGRRELGKFDAPAEGLVIKLPE